MKDKTTATASNKASGRRAGAQRLIIVESPHKATTIAKFLGPGYVVMSSKGHIRDLPLHSLGIDIDKGFKINYEIQPDSVKVVTGLRSAAKKASEILLASDPDREGEAIAWHLHEVLAPAAKDKVFKRIQYNEITPRAVRAAIENPGEINTLRVDAQQARRAIDRIVGYKVSPLVWKNIKGGSSAGRVQSVALRLVCEREAEIDAFNPVAYWVLGAILQKRPAEPFFAKLAKIDGEKASVSTAEQANDIYEDLKTRRMEVESVNAREISRHALPPFITSSLQRAASSVLGFTPGRTMSIAQRLYEGVEIGGSDESVGLITYMRTDAPAVSKEAQEAARGYIWRNYGPEYRPEQPNFYKSGAKAQEAHEAIRPTDVNRTPAMLAGKIPADELKLYDLIWRRFVASQMTSAKFSQKTVLFDATPTAQTLSGKKYTLSATSTEVAFPGFMKVMALDIRKAVAMPDGKDVETTQDDEDEESTLPELAAGETLETVEIKSERKETKPPARYSEAMLIDTLEKNGIGRPSTYATTMETLIKNDYVSRERRVLAPTDIGKAVNAFLVDKLPDLFNVSFTAEMEDDLDKIESGTVQWRDLLERFYAKFTTWMAETKSPPADVDTVRAVLSLLASVTEWIPAEKRGRHTFDDHMLAKSIAAQLRKGKRPVSKKQLTALGNMAWRYRSQIPGAEERLRELGMEVTAKPENPDTPQEIIEKLERLAELDLAERQKLFIASITRQAKSGRNLSERQVAAVERIFRENFTEDGEGAAPAPREETSEDESHPEDTESPELIAKLEKVSTWGEPVKRGNRTFDDAQFFQSVKAQFERRNYLSDKQRAALRRLANRYKEQIEGTVEQPPAK